jgi:hypothetical protein
MTIAVPTQQVEVLAEANVLLDVSSLQQALRADGAYLEGVPL